MTASRKLYVAVANRFQQASQMSDENDRGMWRITVLAAAAAFKDDNSGFNTSRFLAASGFTEAELSSHPARV